MPSSSTHVARGERRVGEHHVAAAHVRGTSRLCIAPRPALHPLGEAQRHEVVHRRRPHAAALRRVHPVGVVEDVEGAEEPLRRRPAGPAPGLSPGVREGQEAEPRLDRDAGERCRDRLQALRARRREGDDLVLVAGRLREPCQRAAQVAADPEQGVRERRDVEDDPQGRYAKLLKCDAEHSRVGVRRADHDTGHSRVLHVEAGDAATRDRRQRHAELDGARRRHDRGRVAARRERDHRVRPREQVRIALELRPSVCRRCSRTAYT